MTTIQLSNDALTVELAKPGVLYQGTRFDWSGFITQVILKGIPGGNTGSEASEPITYCVPESMIPGKGSGGIGICNEFGIQEPVGFDEIDRGGVFPKFGVGVLEKTGDAYNFMQNYPCEPFPFSVEQTSPEQICFTIEPVPCRGYAVQLKKTIRLLGSKLLIDYHLFNTGEKAIRTTEYAHNFIGFNGRPYGKNSMLRLLNPRLQAQAAAVGMPDIFLPAQDGYLWSETPEKEYYARFAEVGTAGPQWELTDGDSGGAVRESTDFAPLRIAFWGKAHVASPEVFILIDLEPGASRQWQRSYEFFRVT